MKKYFIVLMAVVSITFFSACNKVEVPPITDDQDESTENDELLDNDNLGTDTDTNGTPDDDLDVDILDPDILNNGNNTDDNLQDDVEVIEYQTLLISTTNSLNIRSGASTSYASVGNINSGDMVLYTGESGSFYSTLYKGKTAYVSKSYVKKVEFQMSDNDGIESAIAYGIALLGTPYELGAQRLHWGNGILNTNYTGTTYDCSSLVQYMYYYGMGINLDVTSRSQSVQGTAVATGDLQRGDIMFFTNSSRYYNTGIDRIGHVGVYLGNNYILHTASDYAVIEELSATRWSYFIHAMRHT